MQQFIEFVIHHWVLWLALLVVVLLLVKVEMSGVIAGTPVLSSQQAIQLMNHHHALVIDIRDEKSYQQGHIIESINIPGETLESKINKLKKYVNRPVIVIDQQGNLAPKFASKLRQMQFKQVYALRGGLRTWQQENLPLHSEPASSQ